MSCLSIAGAYHLDFELPQWLSTASGGRLGPNPFMLLLLISIIGGAVIAAAVPLRESTVLLYNAATRQEVRLNEWQGYTREPSNVPGRSNGWVGVCAGGRCRLRRNRREARVSAAHRPLILEARHELDAEAPHQPLQPAGGEAAEREMERDKREIMGAAERLGTLGDGGMAR